MAKVGKETLEKHNEWRHQNVLTTSLMFTKKSGIIDALEKMQEETGMKIREYLRMAIADRLKEDGFLPEKSE